MQIYLHTRGGSVYPALREHMIWQTWQQHAFQDLTDPAAIQSLVLTKMGVSQRW